MYGYIYKTTNLVNGKIYIGKKVSQVFVPTYYGSGRRLKIALNKYGKENFDIIILKECNSDEELCTQEKYFIELFKSQQHDVGYNIHPGGKGGSEKGWSMSESAKRSHSIAMKGKNKGRHLSEEHKQKIRDGLRKYTQTEQCKINHSNQMKKRWLSQEYRLKMTRRHKKEEE